MRLHEDIAAGVSGGDRLDGGDRRIGEDRLPDPLQGGRVDGGVQKDPHAALQDLPASSDDEEGDEEGRRPVEGQAEPLADQGEEDEGLREGIGLELGPVRHEAGGVGGLSGPHLVEAEEEGDGDQGGDGEYDPVVVDRGGLHRHRMAGDLEGG